MLTLRIWPMSLLLMVTAPAMSAPLYTITQRTPLGDPDRWDYVIPDPSDHRVYIAHGDRVSVIDSHTGQLLGAVEGLPGGTHGVAISHAAHRGYTVNGRTGEAVSFDLQTLRIEHHIKADADADAVAFDPVSGHIFVVNGDPGTLTVIDPQTDQVVARPQLGSALEYAVSGGNGKLYVNSMEKHEIVRVDTHSNQVDAHWPMPACERPHGLAMDTRTHRLFSGCSNALLTVMDAENGRVLADVPIGKGSDGVAFDPIRHRIFSANGLDGTLSVIDEDGDQFKPLDTIPTQRSGRTLGLDPSTGRIYIVAANVASPAAPAGARPTMIAGTTTLLVLSPQ